jgi:hypothetical protein
MMRPVQQICVFISFGLLSLAGCRRHPLDVDISGIGETVRVERFDRELFEMKMDTVNDAIAYFYDRYGDFFDVFNVHIIGIGPASARRYPSYLSMFVNDPENREVYEYTGRVFSDMDVTNRMLTGGFRHYLYHYPDSALPRIVGYVSRFNQGLFTVEHFVGVGLDQYLGRDCPYYDLMGIPQYLTRNKIPERIPVDVLYAWATRIHPYNDSVDNVLNRIIYQGMLQYFVDAMFPQEEDSLKMGFTAGQLSWCRNNEAQMWTYLVEHRLLFSTDQLVIRKLVEEAPYTLYFTDESPGRAAVWLGWQIVKEFVHRNPGITLPGLMSRRDYQEILRQSRYNP